MFVSYFTEFSDKNYPVRESVAAKTNTLTFSNMHLDREGASNLLRRYLDEAVYAEEMGFDGIALNEHHNSAHCISCVPNIAAATLAAMTKRAKILLVGNILPVTDSPMRLAEELATIDLLSQGRLIPGIVRGSGQEQLATSTNPAYNRERFQEAHDLMIKAWTQPGPWRWEGENFHYRVVNPWVLPLQKPHPRIWMPGVTSPETVAWAAQHAYPFIALATSMDETKQIFSIYDKTAKESGYTAGPEHRGYLLKCHVAETEEKAIQGAKEFLFVNEFTDLGRAEWAQPSGYRTRRAASDFNKHFGVKYFGSEMKALSVEELMASNRIVAGTPKTVIQKLRHILTELRPSILVLWANEGRLSHEDSMTCLRLMGQEVIPALRQMGKEMGLNSPDEIDAPVSLAHAQGAYKAWEQTWPMAKATVMKGR